MTALARSSLRRHLFGFAAVLMTPLLLFAVVLGWRFADSERSGLERDTRAAALRVVAAVDRDLARLQAAAQTLASSAALQSGNYARFHARAKDILAAWPNAKDFEVVVRDLTGQQLVNTRLPWGSPLPRTAHSDIDRRVIETRHPYFQDLFVGATAGRPIVSVRVPVQRSEDVTHVLSIAVEPAHLAAVLRAQNLPPAWTVALVDRNGRVVARSPEHETFVGQATESAFGAAGGGDDGIWTGRNLQGTPVLGAYARSQLAGWHAFVGAPVSIIEAPLVRSLALISALGGALLALSFGSAAWFGGRIAGAIKSLAEAAHRLGRGEPVVPLQTGLREADEVGEALAAASTELRMREAALRANEQRLRATQENAGVGIAEIDREGRFVYVNEAQCRLTGHSRDELIGRHFSHATHPDALARDLELFARQVAGEHDDYSFEKAQIRVDGTIRWARVTSRAVRDEAGLFQYAVRVVQDITEQKAADDRQQLLVNELNHRVKNTLATVQSLVWQSFRGNADIESARTHFESRLIALSKTHNLLNQSSWQGADLVDVLTLELDPYRAEGRPRFSLRGPHVTLPARTAVVLGMSVHELVTNALKHGSLSRPRGRVDVDWRVETMANGPTRLILRWRESGGPPVQRPVEQGFGSRLMRRTIEHELDGSLALRFDAEGFSCTMTVPLEPEPAASLPEPPGPNPHSAVA